MGAKGTYRVLIVDDEPFVRRGIRGAVNWNELGIEMVAEAANGVEALSQFLQDKPDIILLDINMPRMDGLEFANIVKREKPMTRIVIITGYNEFEFARTALRIGIDDYVLKPVTRDAVAGIIRTQIQKLEEAALAAGDQEAEKTAPSGADPALLMNGLLRRDPGSRELLPAFCEEHGLFPGSSVRFVAIREYISGYPEWNEENGPAELAKFAILNIAEERLRELKAGFAFTTYRNEMSLVLTCPDRQAVTLLEELKNNIVDLLEIPVDFGVSERRPIGELDILVEQARDALECGFILHDAPFLSYEDVARRKKESRPYPKDKETELLDHLFGEEAEITLGRIDALFSALAEATFDVRQSRQYLNRFLVTLARTIESVSSWSSVPLDADVSEITDSAGIGVAEDFKTLDEARLWMRDYYMRTYNYMRGVVSRSGQIFMTIRAYIENNYMHSDLNLKKCAEELYLSASYISATIRKESGRSFVDFLNEHRIAQATKLLAQPGARINDVSEKVGFTHPTYFSTVFKKVMGESPTHYKSSLQKNQKAAPPQ